MLEYESIGTTKQVSVYPKPERVAGEDDAAFALRLKAWEPKSWIAISVELLPRPAVREWGFALASANARNEKLAREAGLDLGATYEGTEGVVAVHRAYLAKCLRGVTGFSIAGVDVSTLTDPAEMVRVLEDTDHIGPAAAVARARQSPTPAQRD